MSAPSATKTQPCAQIPRTRHRRFLRNHHRNLSSTLIELGDYAGAVRNALALPKLYPESPTEHLRAAELVAQCVPLAQKYAALGPERGQQTAESYARQAVELLGQAIGKGHRDVAKLPEQKEFAAIKDRADFRALLESAPKSKPTLKSE